MRVALLPLPNQVGQVVGLFIVGLSEYAVVAFGTDWDLEVSKAAERNKLEERSK